MRSPVPTGTVDLVTTTTGPLQHASQLADRFEHVSEVGVAVAAPRRSPDRDEDRFRALDALGEIGREAQAAALGIGLDQRLETRLPDRHDAVLQRIDLARILVDAADFVTEIGKARAGDEPHIAGADHRNAHSSLLRGWAGAS